MLTCLQINVPLAPAHALARPRRTRSLLAQLALVGRGLLVSAALDVHSIMTLLTSRLSDSCSCGGTEVGSSSGLETDFTTKA